MADRAVHALDLEAELRAQDVSKAHAANSVKKAALQRQTTDAYTNFNPQPLPQLPKVSKPILPKPKTKEKEDKPKASSKRTFFNYTAPPFNTDSGSDLGSTSHPQVVMANIIESSCDVMGTGRKIAGDAIINVYHPKQDKKADEFGKKLEESMKIAQEHVTLTYIQSGLKILAVSTGIVGGVMLQMAGISTGNSAALFYGAEMTVGGLMTLGSHFLSQAGSGDNTWSSLAAIGGALLSLHGGVMGFPLLADKLSSHAAMVYNSTLTLLMGYTDSKRLGAQAKQSLIQGEVETLQKDRKDLSDSIKKQYGALNIKDFALLFKMGSDFVQQMNRATARILQGELQA